MTATGFDTLDLAPELVRATRDLGYETPTPIQRDAIPHALAGKDLLAAAATGSGKTAAFLLPIVHRLAGKPRGKTRALILAPTRELAAQIADDLKDLAQHTGVRGAAIFGGVGMKPQEDAFRRGVDILVATPGRLLDHFQYPYAKLDSLEVLVLDEADRMLDMGFLPDIRRVLRHLPDPVTTRRQTLFFSATLPAPIVQLSAEMLRNPTRVGVERKAAPAKGISQAVYPVAENRKTALFLEMLKRDVVGGAIVFCRTKHRANRLAERLDKAGVSSAAIHGNRSQTRRVDALEGFKSGRYRVLVATDIVARGIDVEALEHVVNFDVPNVPEDYIHRVGRTARAERTGEAYTLVSPDEEGDLRAIERAVGKPIERRTLPDFEYKVAGSDEPLEVPLGQRIAEIRARKADERARAKAKEARRTDAQGSGQSGSGSRPREERRPGSDSQRGGESRGGGGGSHGRPAPAGAAGGRSGFGGRGSSDSGRRGSGGGRGG